MLVVQGAQSLSQSAELVEGQGSFVQALNEGCDIESVAVEGRAAFPQYVVLGVVFPARYGDILLRIKQVE